MCGRYTLTISIDDLVAQLDLDLPDFEVEPRYNIAPTQRLPVITNEDPHALHLHRWGLIPFWAKDPSIGNKMINARGETVASKPAFRNAFRKHRCLVPADGFYEWKKTPAGKVPHHIHLEDRTAMTFGGLWETWEDPEGKAIRSFTIITTGPNALMAELHDRMPLIVPPQRRADWLNTGLPEEDVQAIIRPFPDGPLTADRVSTKVNSPRNEGPELLGPPDTLF